MRKKVLHVITGLGDGGAEGVLTRLCLNSRKAEHVVVSLTDEGKYGSVLRESGIAVYSLEMNPRRPSLPSFFRLVKLISKQKPDVVQTWLYHSDLFGGLAARMAGIRNIFWNIRLSNLHGGSEKKATVLTARVCAKLSSWLPKGIICCAEKAAKTHLELGYDKSKLVVIPNGYDLDKYSPNQAFRNLIRNEFQLGTDEIVLGMVGRFHLQKDHHNLLTALGYVKESRIPFRCLLVGSDLNEANLALISQINEMGLKNEVILAGQRRDIPMVMSALDIHILSSRYEGFPNVIAEAMACGTPCVSTDVGDASVIIGKTGVVCRVGNPEELANGILQLAIEKSNNDEAWHSRMAECRERIMSNYTLDKSVSRYEDVWEL